MDGVQTTRFCPKCLSAEKHDGGSCAACGVPLLALFDGSGALTRAYLAARGYCCANGCRNCPYPKDDAGISPKIDPPKTKTCPRCGARFGCGGDGCWCGALTLASATLAQLRRDYDDCLCPACLSALSAADCP